MDKLVIQLFADILYIKGIICYDEMDTIMKMKTPQDVEAFTERLLRGEFSAFKRGEIYTTRT